MNHLENLTKLYLRLKGFMVSNIILHSDQPGTLNSELDILAWRMPYHQQEYRKVEDSDYLNCSNNRIEIIIADVKDSNSIANVKFNDGLRKNDKCILDLINWIGCFETINTELIQKFHYHLNLHKIMDWKDYSFFDEDLLIGKFRIKFTFFCPSLKEWPRYGFKYVHGSEMVSFVWNCLNTQQNIDTCSRQYDFRRWNEFESYVKYFKKSKDMVTIDEFRKHFNM